MLEVSHIRWAVYSLNCEQNVIYHSMNQIILLFPKKIKDEN